MLESFCGVRVVIVFYFMFIRFCVGKFVFVVIFWDEVFGCWIVFCIFVVLGRGGKDVYFCSGFRITV